MLPKAMNVLIDSFMKLPNIGLKTATRLAYRVAEMKTDEVERLANAILNVKHEIHTCEVCFNTIDSDKNICEICASEDRNDKIICVVKDARDLEVIEHTHTFNGKYHVTGGLISPTESNLQENMHLEELLKRVKSNRVQEVIMAFESTVTGDAMSLFVARLLSSTNVIVTRLAKGLAVGADFSSTDNLTIAKAIENRIQM